VLNLLRTSPVPFSVAPPSSFSLPRFAGSTKGYVQVLRQIITDDHCVHLKKLLQVPYRATWHSASSSSPFTIARAIFTACFLSLSNGKVVSSKRRWQNAPGSCEKTRPTPSTREVPCQKGETCALPLDGIAVPAGAGGARHALGLRPLKSLPIQSQLPNNVPQGTYLEILGAPVGHRGNLTSSGIMPLPLRSRKGCQGREQHAPTRVARDGPCPDRFL
jgi:hypothetical protein